MKNLLFILAIILPAFVFAQNGKITGKVLNGSNGEPLVGATVSIEKPSKSTSTDQTGSYTLGNLMPGIYTIKISYVGFSSKEVSDVVVKANEVTDLSINLDVKTQSTLGDVVVRSKAKSESLTSLMLQQKNAAILSDGIPAEIIKRTPDRSTSDVLKRVSGAAIQDDKFAVIRGLNDRYNAAFLNGAPLPSSESDRKAFAFDIFPSNMLENLVISKTASPDMSGEFGGGIINITTNSIPSKNFTSLSLGTGLNTVATFKDRKTYPGGNTDWLGIDDGTRAIPGGVPPAGQFPSSPAVRGEMAKQFSNDWAILNKNTPVNYNFQVTQGLNIPNKKGAEFLGLLMSLTYNRNYNTYNDGDLLSYEYDRTNASAPPILRGNFLDDVYQENTLVGAIANVSMKINNNNRISWKNIYSINSDNRTIIRNGQSDASGDPDFLSYASARWFTSNQIFSTQLNGDHTFSKSKIKINWLGSLGTVKREIPNLRQMQYGLAPGETDYVAAVPAGTVSADNSGSMFFSNTDEKIYNAKVDVSKPLDFSDKITNTIKIGAYYQYRDRVFDARLLGMGRYVVPGSVSFENSLLTKNESEIFAQENMGRLPNGKGGFLLLDGTRPTYAYTANSSLWAAYLMMDTKFSQRLRAVYGVRVEDFTQKLNSMITFTEALAINTNKTDFLPSINLIYSLNKKQNLRFAYSRTLNRPEFRELAPFAFFDFSTRYVITGVDSLQRALIDNFDLRYEVYPGRGQVLSATAFYKYFSNPIELVSNPSLDREALYQNARKAYNYGVEFEMRSILGNLIGASDNDLLNKFTLSANAAFIWSEVTVGDFGQISAKDLIEKRPLQGQSPYIFNASAAFNDEDHGWSSTLSVNRVGQRIYIVGSVSDPDVWEQGRTLLDFQVSKTFINKKLELKLNVKDMLRQKQIFFLDIDESSSYKKDTDYIFQTRNFGTTFSLTATYKF